MGALPVAAFFGLMVSLAVANSSVAYESPALLATLNTVFLCGVPLAVAFLAAKDYRATGSLALLMLGCGLLSLAVSSLLAGWVMPVSGKPNSTVTLHNLGALLAGACHLASAHFLLSELAGKLLRRRGAASAPLLYFGIMALFAAILIMALAGKLPVFFDQQTGPSPLRQCVLGGALCMFAVSGFVFLQIGRTVQTKFAYWYGLALLLISVGLAGVLLQKTVGGDLSWTGRSAQYLGSIYFIVAVLRGRREITSSTADRVSWKLWPYLEQRIKTETNWLAEDNATLRHEIAERRRIEGALRSSEEKYRLLVENQNDLVIQFDPANRIQFVSPTYCAAFGKSEAELVGSSFFPLVHEDDRARVAASLQRVLAPPYATQHEERNLTVAGWRWFAWSAKAALSPDGQVASIIGVGRDVSERKQAEEAQQASEERYRRLFEESLDGICLVDAQTGLIKDCNPALLKLLGWEKHELVGQSQRILHPPNEALGNVTQSFAQHRQEKAGQIVEVPVITKTGNVLWAEIMANVRAVQGSEVMVGIFRNITERRETEAVLRTNMAALRHAQEIAHLGNWSLDLQSNYVTWSEGMYQIFGTTPETFDHTPQGVAKFIHREDAARQFQSIETLMQGQAFESFQYRVVHATGETRVVHVYHAELERDAAGQPVRAYGAVQDITERVKQQDKLQELLAQTEQDARTKGELLKEVNHRVTNNLTAVLGLLVHEKEYVSSSERNLVAPILDRLQQRIRGLLQVHRMLAQSAWAPVGVDKLAQEVIRGALSAAPWRHQAVITIKPGALKMSPRQAGGLALVLNELTTNTLKYGRQPPHSVAISLEAESHEEWATICYRDNGPGYPVEVLAGQRANVGLKLINEIVTKTLRGSLVLANDQGAVAVIRVQLEDENRT